MRSFCVLVLFFYHFFSFSQYNKEEIIFVAPFQNEIVSWYRLKNNNKVGVITKDSTFITSPKFDYINLFRNGYAEAGIFKNRKMYRGIINGSGDFVIPMIYDEIYLNEFDAIIGLNNKQGIVSLDNEIVLPTSFDLVRKCGDFYIVMKNNQLALFTLSAGFISDFIYKDLINVFDKKILVRDDQFQYVINTEGEIIYKSNLTEEIFDIKDDRMIVKTNNSLKYRVYQFSKNRFSDYSYDQLSFSYHDLKVKHNDQWGMINLENEVLIPIVYDHILNLNNYTIVKKNNEYGLYYKYNLALPLQYEKIISHRDEAYFFVQNKQGNSGLYDSDMKPIIEEKGKVLLYNNDSYLIEIGNQLVVYNIITHDSIHLDESYSYEAERNHFLDISKSYCIVVKKGSKYGAVTYLGEVAIPFEYEELNGIYASPHFIAKKNGKFGIIDKDNVIEKAFIYDKAELVKEVVFLYKKNKRVDSYPISFK